MFGYRKQYANGSHQNLIEVWDVHNAWNVEAAKQMADISPEFKSSASTPSERYWIDPVDLLRAQHYARDRQMDIIGIYHSHPDHPAIPSECDRACAWSAYSYLIASVQHGQVANILCWKLDDQQGFQSESIIMTQTISTQ
jgi:proteasome lid subunit RPN8/RPN11